MSILLSDVSTYQSKINDIFQIRELGSTHLMNLSWEGEGGREQMSEPKQELSFYKPYFFSSKKIRFWNKFWNVMLALQLNRIF